MKPQAGKLVRHFKSHSILSDFPSIDVETEQNLKRVIETRFQDHTVIAVAHRLETVMDFDRVVVFEQGKIVEVGKPRELLESTGYFRSLWDASHTTST